MNIQMIEEATSVVKEKLGWDALQDKPKISVVLGSGLGRFADELKDKREISFTDIPHMPESTVQGHAGKFVVGVNKEGTTVLVQQGRLHLYEGYDLSIVTFSIRLHKALGVEHIVLTTSTGSINPDYNPGEFVLIRDHINFPQVSPLTGLDVSLGERFIDMSEAYNLEVIDAVMAHDHPNMKIHSGVFAMVVGPHYETPAEIQALYRLGADVVSMSTVPEVLVARQCGLKINAIANITNYGSGLRKQTLDHDHVAKAAQASSENFIRLLDEVIRVAKQQLS